MSVLRVGKTSNWVRMGLVLMMIGAMMPMSFAETRYKRVYDTETHSYYYVPEETSLKGKVQNSLKNPIVKQAAIGAAVGTAAGVLSDRSSVTRSLGIGALIGAGTGLLDSSTALDDKPMLKTALKGAAIGTGASAITRNSAVKGALLGGAAGAGYHYLKDRWNNEPSGNRYSSWW